jgi:hypothetical protein
VITDPKIEHPLRINEANVGHINVTSTNLLWYCLQFLVRFSFSDEEKEKKISPKIASVNEPSGEVLTVSGSFNSKGFAIQLQFQIRSVTGKKSKLIHFPLR